MSTRHIVHEVIKRGPAGDGISAPEASVIRNTIAPLEGGFADQKQLIPDGASLGWYDGPVMVANWAPYKADVSGAVDTTARLQSFLDAVSASKIPGVVLPGQYRADGIINVKSNTKLLFHGAELQTYNPSLGTGGYGNNVPLLRLDDVENVIIEGGVLNGRKSVAAWGPSEHKHGIALYGSRNVTIRDMRIIDCKGDGVYTEPKVVGSTRTQCANLLMDRVMCDGNHRQGLSILSLDGGRFIACDFVNTSGTNPQSGVDIEPENAADTVRDLGFTDCRFNGNAGSGFVIFAKGTNHRNITVRGGSVRNNTGWGVWLNTANDVAFRDIDVDDNGDIGVWMLQGQNVGVTFDNVRMRRNGKHGFRVGGEYGATSWTHGMISNCLIANNGASGSGWSGIYLGSSSYATDLSRLTIRDTIIGGAIRDHVAAINVRTGTTISASAYVNVDVRTGNTYKFYLQSTGVNGIPAGVVARDNPGYVTRNAGVSNVASGAYINHGLASAPTKYGATGTIEGEFVTVTEAGANAIRIRITKHDGTVGTAQNVAWWAEV